MAVFSPQLEVGNVILRFIDNTTGAKTVQPSSDGSQHTAILRRFVGDSYAEFIVCNKELQVVKMELAHSLHQRENLQFFRQREVTAAKFGQHLLSRGCVLLLSQIDRKSTRLNSSH